MPAYTTLTLDTTAPGGVAIALDGGSAFTTDRDVILGVSTTDNGGAPVGYQMKVWGDVDEAFDAQIQQDEGDSGWISFDPTKVVRVTVGDGPKTVNVRVRDDVWNESAPASDTITLDSAAPVPTISVAISPTKISKVAGKRTATFEWSTDVPFDEYKVKVVPSNDSTHTAGAVIAETNSTNTQGADGGYPAATNIVTTIDGVDLESASGGDGAKIIKVFVKDAAGNWSV